MLAVGYLHDGMTLPSVSSGKWEDFWNNEQPV